MHRSAAHRPRDQTRARGLARIGAGCATNGSNEKGGARAAADQARRWRAADALIIHGEEPRNFVEASAPGVPVYVVPVDLPRTGTVWLHTTVTVAPPGYAGPVPYGLGIVELDGDPLLRVVSRLHGEDLARGAPVELGADEVPGPDGEPAVTWVFHT